MTLSDATGYATDLARRHPPGCSCGSPDCLSRYFDHDEDCEELDRTGLIAAIIRDQTDATDGPN